MDTYKRHPVLDRLVRISNIPYTATAEQLIEMFDLVLGKGTLAFLDYRFENGTSNHKGYAFALLTTQEDVRYCFDKNLWQKWYLVGPKGEDGYNKEGRAYLSFRSARVNLAGEDDVPTTLVFWQPKESQQKSPASYKKWVEDIIGEMGITPVKVETESLENGYRGLNVHFKDQETAGVVKMLTHFHSEDDHTILVRYASKNTYVNPLSGAKAAYATTISAQAAGVASATVITKQALEASKKAKSAPRLVEKSIVLEPVPENPKFGQPYTPKRTTRKEPEFPEAYLQCIASGADVRT
jgi:hypothetical protein